MTDRNLARHRGLLTVTVMMATVMHALDSTIANVALPSIQGSLSATQDQASWVLTSYIVVSAILTPLAGFLVGRLGRRRLFLGAIVGFTLASMLCGAAQTLDQLVAFRALQGGFGAALVPLSQALLLDAYPPERHSWAMAIWGVGVMVGPISGPALGGWLTDALSWRWVFYVNLPVGILTALGVWWLVTDSEHDRPRPFDLMGFALLALAIGAMQLMLDRGELQDWFDSPEIVLLAAVAAVALAMFVLHTATVRHPFMSLELFEDRNLILSLVFSALAGGILIVTAALVPPFLQQLKGYPVLTTGYVMAPRGVGMMVAMMLVARLAPRVDPRILMAFGLSMTALSLHQMTEFSLDVAAWPVLWSGVVQGFGLGFVFVPISTLMFATIAPSHRTEAAGLNALLRNLGGSVGIAVLVFLLTRGTHENHAGLAEAISHLNPNWAAAAAAAGSTAEELLATWERELNRQAAMVAYLNDFRALMWAVLGTMPLLLMFRAVPLPGRAAARGR